MLDIFGTLISLVCTYYFINLSRKAWVLTIIATTLNTCLYWQKGIYADTVLEAFYFLSALIGLYLWKKKERNIVIEVRVLSGPQWLLLALSVTGLFAIIKILLMTYTSSTVPNLDALTTALSLVAQCLMLYKIITTWILWLIADFCYAYLYLQKNIPFHVLLVLIYSIMAVIGYYSWFKQLRNNVSVQPMAST